MLDFSGVAKEQFAHRETEELLTMLDGVAAKAGSRGEVFADFLTMTVCALAGGTMEEEYLATVQKYVAHVVKRAGFRVKVTPRTLRHCYATHLIEKGTSTRVVQVLLGHSNVHTTETYTHVSPQTMGKIVSPLDQIAALLSEPVHD